MGAVSTRQWGSLERGSPTLFLVGGALVVGHAAIRGIEAFAEMTPPPDVFGPAGYLLALLGLLGLYPSLVERTPRVARAAAAVAAVPLVGWVVISAWSVGAVAGVVPPQSDVLPAVFYVGHVAAVTLTYTLFGVAALHAGVHSRTVGLLLLAPAILMIASMAGVVVVGDSLIGAFVVGSGQALVHLSIGGALRAERTTADHETPSGDATAG